MRFLATAAKGLEKVAAGELKALGLRVRTVSPGVVAFEGKWSDAYRANLWLRVGRRVLWPVGEIEARDAASLYEGVRGLNWPEWIPPDRTFAVEAKTADSVFSHSGFVALKVKDAVADAVRDEAGRRPSVDRKDPDVGIKVLVTGKRCFISLDTSGGPLHKRGYRKRSVAGALNETLAAGILLLAEYDGSLPFADPFCGSGTIVVEAALIASGTAPGLLRQKPFGFERWPGFDGGEWRALVAEAKKAVHPPGNAVLGSDSDRAATAAAVLNAKAAGVGEWVEVDRIDVADFSPAPAPGFIVSNPPYGDHAGGNRDLPGLYHLLGDVLKRRCQGHAAFLLVGDRALAKGVGLHPSRRIPLWNGPKACTLLAYELYEGSRKGK